MNQIQWGPNVWNKHWEFPHGLGAVSARIPENEQTGFAKDYQWNLNPNDFHADHRSKALDYIAAIAVKTATNRDGVNISPYNTRHLTDYFGGITGFASPRLDTVAYAAQIDRSELNQGEVETRSCQNRDPAQCFTYFNKPDVSSTGNIGTNGFGVVDINVGRYYVDNGSNCSWRTDWGFPAMSTFTAGYVRPEPVLGLEMALPDGTVIGSTLPLVNSSFQVAVNLGDHEIERCPTWNVCQSVGSQFAVHLYSEDVNFQVVPPPSGVRIPPGQPGTRDCPQYGNYRCQQVLCGLPLSVQSSDSQVRDWWVCAGNCARVGANWQLGCSNTTACVITVADNNLTVVGIPNGLSRTSTASALAQQILQ